MNPASVLVVEDNPITRKMVRVALASEGYAVLEASDGRTALELLGRHAPDLILQDLLLPDMDGFDLVQQIRATPAGAALPVLAVSGFLSKMEQARSLRVGFTDYLFKPVEPSLLLSTVRAYLRPATALPGKPGLGRRVLVVDDDPQQLKLLRVQLEQVGFQVSVAEDGVVALEQARASPPDAVASDVLMPRLDGFRLCLALRHDPALAAVPVVLVSAVYTQESDQELAATVGASAFVLRTPGHGEVIEALLACLGRTPAAPAGPVHLPVEEYTHRVLRQLEHQVNLGAALARRLALLEAELGILARVVETLQGTAATEDVLGELLHRCLDAAGISRGAAYLLDPDGRLSLKAWLGYPESAAAALREFFGHADLLRRTLDQGEPLEVNLGQSSGTGTAELLTRSGARSILLTPLLLGGKRLGVLEMASGNRELGEDWLAFAKSMGSQIAQALELADTLARLAASEQRYRDLVHGLDAVVWEADTEGRFTFVSPAVERLLGHPMAAWLEGQGWVGLLHPDDREQTQAQRAAAAREGRDHSMEYRVLAGDGRLLRVQDTARVVRDEAGQPAGLRGVLVDITERWQAEDALRRSESLLRAVLEGTTDAVFVKDLQGRYLLMNAAGARYLRRTVDDVLGRRDVELFAPESARQIEEDDARILAAGTPRTYEEAVTVAGVTRTNLTVKAPYRDTSGRILGLIGIARDVTDRVRAREQEAGLRLARQVQQGFFPSAPPRLPGFDVSGVSYPAVATGGDYFDYLPLPDGGLAFVVADASGHGFAAALLMAECRAYLRALMLTHSDLGEVLALLNRALTHEDSEVHFVTLLLARLDPGSRLFRHASAGHPTGYVLDPVGGVKAALVSAALPLGIDPQADFPPGPTVTLEPGDLVVLLTDGILEAQSPEGTFFGDGRVLDVVRACRSKPADAIVARLCQAVQAFSGLGPQSDDITAVVIKVEASA